MPRRETKWDIENQRRVVKIVQEKLSIPGPLIERKDDFCEWDFRLEDSSIYFEIKCRGYPRGNLDNYAYPHAKINLLKLIALLNYVRNGKRVIFANGWHDHIDIMELGDFEEGVRLMISLFNRADRPKEIKWIAQIPIGNFRIIAPSPPELRSPNMGSSNGE